MAKYTQAQAEAMQRYREKTLKRHMFELRIDEDRDIIESIEDAVEHGIPKRQWLSDIFHYGGSPKEVVPEGLVKLSDVEKVLMQ